MKWSILVLSWDRPNELKRMFENNIAPIASQRNIEVLVCDQGSNPVEPIREFLGSLPYVSYVRYNPSNEGVARSLNQLLLRSTGDAIAIMGNDILLPNDWWRDAERAFFNVPKCGIVGWACAMAPTLPAQDYDGLRAHPVKKDEAVFGDWCFTRELLNDVGAICEHYHPYGLEDSDYNFRVNLAGYNSAYIADKVAGHVCNDVGQKTKYREMKNFSLETNSFNHQVRARSYARFGYYVPFPAMI